MSQAHDSTKGLFETQEVETFQFDTATEAATEALGERLAREILPPDSVVLLEGELGSGKTVLVRGMARALGVDPREVQSPTYALIHEHAAHDGGRLVHADLYRVEPDEVESIGLDELIAGPGWKAIEWPDRLPSSPPGAWRVAIARRGTGRRVTLRPSR